MESALPPPIEFTATADELEPVYASLGPKSPRKLGALFSVQAVAASACALMSFGIGGRSGSTAWLFLALAIAYFASAFVQFKVVFDERRVLASPPSLRVAFSDSAIDVTDDERDSLSARTIALRSVRSVRIVADALVVFTSAVRNRPALVIPLRALPDGGDAVMRYFDDRIVAKRMLHRGSDARTTLVNTALR